MADNWLETGAASTTLAPRPAMSESPYRCSVLLLDDQPGVLALLARQLGREFDTATASTTSQAETLLGDRSFDIIVSDLQLGSVSGIAFLDWVRRTYPRTARVLLTGTARLEDAAQAINCCQVHRLVLKPWRMEDLLENMRAVSRPLLLERSHEKLLEEYRTLTEDLERRVKDRTRQKFNVSVAEVDANDLSITQGPDFAVAPLQLDARRLAPATVAYDSDHPLPGIE